MQNRTYLEGLYPQIYRSCLVYRDFLCRTQTFPKVLHQGNPADFLILCCGIKNNVWRFYINKILISHLKQNPCAVWIEKIHHNLSIFLYKQRWKKYSEHFTYMHRKWPIFEILLSNLSLNFVLHRIYPFVRPCFSYYSEKMHYCFI
jgi:hypothetical protein